MPGCPACGSEYAEGKGFCSDCGASVARTSTPTQTSFKSTPSSRSQSSFDQARFIPGTVLAKRYRIVGLLGRGGMGEVYRAEDLKLGRPVALKFLPEIFERDEARLGRFLDEVRVALNVSHPNVCRVHDIGEVRVSTDLASPEQGQHYLSMEYVDGEDLASLLRRIGRLPQDKASQIARQLCAGVAAAHEQGILHRDLKPANVMIDGRGRAKITDFGLASLAEGIRAEDVRSGTPSYMAPEQLAGRDVSVRSDLYALGLVLYELFTGKKAYEAQTPDEMARLQQESNLSQPSRHVQGLDPAVERAILQCLENDPNDRPSSALAVAAALPGGDPLAAALAAGETPSPEMVAAAGPRGALRPGVATTCLLVLVAGMVAAALFGGSLFIHTHVPMVKSFEALKDDAAEIAAALGYEEPPENRYAAFQILPTEYWYVLKNHEPGTGWEVLEKSGQGVLGLFYRQSPRSLVPQSLTGRVSHWDPPKRPGDILMYLDLRGRLVRFEATAPRASWTREAVSAVDWSSAFEAAGLEIDAFEPTEPTSQPVLFVEERHAWSGTLPDRGDLPVRVEAATSGGKPVYFELVLPSDPYWEEQSEETTATGIDETPGFIALSLVVLGAFGLVLFGIVFLAVRNLKLGRGDRKGALRLGLAIIVLRLLHWLFTGHHVPNLGEIYLVAVALSGAIVFGCLTWILYIALEPYLRRVWPRAIVAWNRLLAGRFRDPLVGRDILLGLAFSGGLAILFSPLADLAVSKEWVPPFPQSPLNAMRGGRFALGQIFQTLLGPLAAGLFHIAVFMLARVVLRKTWIAAVVYGSFMAATQAFGMLTATRGEMSHEIIFFALFAGVLTAATVVFLLIRFGLLALVAYFFCEIASQGVSFPVTTDTSAPYFTSGMIGPLLVLGLAIYAFRVSLAGRPLFRDEHVEPSSVRSEAG